MDAEVIRKIAAYSKNYKNSLKDWNKEWLKNDWYYALRFFFSHSFYRGRRDQLSEIFEKRAEKVIEKLTKNSSFDNLMESLQELDKKLQKGKVNNSADREMVVQTIKFIASFPNHNMVKYSLDEITNGNIEKLYQNLLSIKFIGDKLATFYLRDLDFLFNIHRHLSDQDYLLLQPIDTWVKQISKKIQIINGEKDPYLIKRLIIKACINAKVNPNDFNVGAWYVGAKRILI